MYRGVWSACSGLWNAACSIYYFFQMDAVPSWSRIYASILPGIYYPTLQGRLTLWYPRTPSIWMFCCYTTYTLCRWKTKLSPVLAVRRAMVLTATREWPSKQPEETAYATTAAVGDTVVIHIVNCGVGSVPYCLIEKKITHAKSAEFFGRAGLTKAESRPAPLKHPSEVITLAGTNER